MKRLLTTTALVLSFAAAPIAAVAETTLSDYKLETSRDHLASELIGMRIYAADPDDSTAGSKDWDDIGEINDLVVTKDGEIAVVVLGVGGFLGIGEKNVAVEMSGIEMVTDEDGDRFLVVKTTREALEDAPIFVTDVDEMETVTNATNAQSETENSANEDMDREKLAAFDADRPRLDRPAVEREGYNTVEYDFLTAEQIDGATVYGINDESVGEIERLIVTKEGKMQHAVIDVGGFLGLGEKPVLVGFDELQIVKNADGDDVRIYIDSSEEALEQQPEFRS